MEGTGEREATWEGRRSGVREGKDGGRQEAWVGGWGGGEIMILWGGVGRRRGTAGIMKSVCVCDKVHRGATTEKKEERK